MKGIDEVNFKGFMRWSCTAALALIFAASSAVTHAVLVAHWPLDDGSGGTATEVVGGQDGTLNNFPGDDSQWVAGVVGGALDFDGFDDFISHGFTLPRTEGTIMHWVNTSANDTRIIYYESDFPAEANDYDGNTSAGTVLEIHTGWQGSFGEYCGIYEDGDEQIECGVATPGQWTHFAMTWDTSGDLVIYVDCQEADRGDLSGLSFDNRTTTERYIGRPSDSVRFFDGLLDDIRIYDTALSQQEIAPFCPSTSTGPAEPIPLLPAWAKASLALLLGGLALLIIGRRNRTLRAG